MKIVAKFQFTAQSKSNEILSQIGSILQEWRSQKLQRADNDQFIIRHSGVSALFEVNKEDVDDWRRNSFTLIEPIPGGDLQTNVDVITTGDRPAFRCLLSVSVRPRSY